MFGNNLKKYRKEKGFSQNDLAEKLFISRQCVSKWERGLTQPDLQTLTQLSELLNVTIDALVKENDNKNKNSSNYNMGFFVANILIALLCLFAFITVWRFMPQTIPTHWTNGVIDKYGSRNEVFINLITVVVFLAVDIFVYFILRQISNKIVIWVSHCVIALFQVAYLIIIISVYAKYLNEILSFITCLSVVSIMCISIAIHPKISKRNYILGVRIKETLQSTAVWNKTNALACYLFSALSLILFVIDILWVSKFNLLLLFGYVLLTIIVIIYAKKIYRTLDKNEV